MSHCYPLTLTKKRKKGQKKSIDLDINKIAVLLPFITGVGPSEIETIFSMLGFPNSIHYKRTISRWQPSICQKIIEISERAMRYAMDQEIKETIIADKGETYYQSWMECPKHERERLG